MAKNKEKKFIEDIEYRLYRIKHYAKKHSWELISTQEEIIEFHSLMLFDDSKVQMTINFLTFEIETSLNHPKLGPTKLKREGKFTMKLIESIFINPRTHMPPQIQAEYKK